MERKSYQLPLGWEVSFPADWQHEYDETDAQNIFYPADSELTVRITAFHAEKDGIPASAAVMAQVLARSVPEGASPFALPELQIGGCKTALFKAPYIEDGRPIMRVIAGIFCTGELLIVNFFAPDADEINRAVPYLCFVRRRDV